jgi:hypothetical protein
LSRPELHAERENNRQSIKKDAFKETDSNAYIIGKNHGLGSMRPELMATKIVNRPAFDEGD